MPNQGGISEKNTPIKGFAKLLDRCRSPINNFHRDPDAHRRRHAGRLPRATSEGENRITRKCARVKRSATVPEVRRRSGVQASVSTVRRVFRMSFTRKKKLGRPKLTSQHKTKRLLVVRDHMTWDKLNWAKVLFSDEKNGILMVHMGISIFGLTRVYLRTTISIVSKEEEVL